MPTLPISTILREAVPESISELYSRDPETYQPEDILRIITEQRAHAERMAAAENAPRTPRASASPRLKGPTVAPAPSGLGLDI